MGIERISYSSWDVEKIIDAFSPEFELEKRRTLGYNTSAEYGTLILDTNTNHLDAYYLSDLPMVVFDLHTDMYSTIKNNVMKRFMNILKTVVNNEDVYDFWIDSPKLYDLESQRDAIRTLINTINSIKTEV